MPYLSVIMTITAGVLAASLFLFLAGFRIFSSTYWKRPSGVKFLAPLLWHLISVGSPGHTSLKKSRYQRSMEIRRSSQAMMRAFGNRIDSDLTDDEVFASSFWLILVTASLFFPFFLMIALILEGISYVF